MEYIICMYINKHLPNKKCRVAWNKGLTKETNIIIRDQAERFHKNAKAGKFNHFGHSQSSKTKEKLSLIRSKFIEEKGRGCSLKDIVKDAKIFSAGIGPVL